MCPSLSARPLFERALPGAAARQKLVGTQRTAAMVLVQMAVAVVLGPLGQPLHQPRRGWARPQSEGRDEREQQEARSEGATAKHAVLRNTKHAPGHAAAMRHADAHPGPPRFEWRGGQAS